MIYLKEPNTNSLKDLISKGFCKIGGRFVETYHDEDCNIRQCREANRSFEDLLEISQTYFPETTPKILIDTLQEIHNTEGGLVCMFCSDIDKPVFYKYSNTYSLFYYVSDGSKKGNSPYCVNDFKELLNQEK